MQMVQSRVGLRIVGLALASTCAALILPACTKEAPLAPSTDAARTADDANGAQATELNWARDALKRNPNVELVATDTSAGVFTIRMKDTGEVRAVKSSELAAVPITSLTATAQTSDPAPTPASQEPAATNRPDSTDAEPGTPASTMAGAPAPTASNSSYTIERTDGQVKVSGPGVSIVSSGTSAVTSDEGSAGQRNVGPIICEGRRMLHLDNRNIHVDGDAIIARGGCELYLTNSRVSAAGTGVIVADATVHIANSTVEGSAASFDARDGAKVYVRSSTLQGLPRRSENAVVQDQGGNQWR